MSEAGHAKDVLRLKVQLAALEELLAVHETSVAEQSARLERTLEQLRASQMRFQSILATASDAILCVDEQQRITLWNQHAETLFGYQADEVIGQPLELLLPVRFRAAHQGHVERFAATAISRQLMSQRPVLRGLRKSGEEFPVEVSISKVRLNDQWVFTAMVRDTTERVKIEETLKKEREELARMNGMMMGREERILELKRQVNGLLKELGRPPEFQEFRNSRDTHFNSDK